VPTVPTLTNQVDQQAAPNFQLRPLQNNAAQTLGQGIANAGQILFRVQQEEQAKEDKAAIIEADRLLGEAENDLLHAPETGAYSQSGDNARGITDKTLSEYDKRASKVDEGLRNPRQKAVFREALNERRVRVQQGLLRHESGQREIAHDNQAQAAIDGAAESAALNWQNPERVAQEIARQHAVINVQAQRKGWNEEERQQALRKSNGFTHTAVIGQMLTANAYGAAKAYYDAHSEEFDAAQRTRIEAAIDAGRVKAVTNDIAKAFELDTKAGESALKKLGESGLSEEDQLEVRKQVRERNGLLHAERRAEYAETVNTLERSITAGAPGQNAEAVAARLYRKGVYSPTEYTNILERIDIARAKGAEDAATIAGIEDAFVNGLRLDPKNEKIVKAVDKWFAEATKVNQVKPGSEEYVSLSAQMAARTNILPPKAMSWARATLLSGEPAITVPAANAMTRWADAAPTAYAYFDDPNLKAYAEQVSSLVQAGASPEKAVEVARANAFDIPEQRKKVLQSTYTKEKYAEDNAGDLQDRMDGDDAFDVEILPGAPQAPLGMRDEYERSVRAYFDRTNGDIERARELAWKDIRGVYGYSRVNGEPEILKYAPELVFPGVSIDVIRNDLNSAATAAGIKTPVNLTPSRATGDTRGILWSLTTTDEDGNDEVLLDEKNRPLIYAIPTDTQAYVEADAKNRRDAIAKARAESEKRRRLVEATAEAAAEYQGY